MATFKTKQEAQEFISGVRARMRDPAAWQIYVHENMGWHCSLRQIGGVVSLNVSKMKEEEPRFWCLISDNPDGAGSGCCLWHGNSNSMPEINFEGPNDAVDFTVRHMLSKAQKRISELQSACGLAGRLLPE